MIECVQLVKKMWLGDNVTAFRLAKNQWVAAF